MVLFHRGSETTGVRSGALLLAQFPEPRMPQPLLRLTMETLGLASWLEPAAGKLCTYAHHLPASSPLSPLPPHTQTACGRWEGEA